MTEGFRRLFQDSNPEIREGLHRMLGACRLATRSCVSMVVQHLLDNLKRYAGDKRSIWRCLQLQGRRHPELVLLLTPQLLALHPFFDMPEPDVEDPVCTDLGQISFKLENTQRCSHQKAFLRMKANLNQIQFKFGNTLGFELGTSR